MQIGEKKGRKLEKIVYIFKKDQCKIEEIQNDKTKDILHVSDWIIFYAPHQRGGGILFC